MEDLINKIYEKKKELNELIKLYSKANNKCFNFKCKENFQNFNCPKNCRKYTIVEECENYITQHNPTGTIGINQRNDIYGCDIEYREDGVLLGSLCLYYYKDDISTCYLSNLMVNEYKRHRFIAKTLMSTVFEYCLAHEYTLISLRVKKTDWVHEWYKRLGFLDYMDDKEDGLIWMVKSIGEKK